MTVDPLGYATTWAYDAFGDMTEVTEWATPLATAGLTAGGPPPAPTAWGAGRVVVPGGAQRL